MDLGPKVWRSIPNALQVTNVCFTVIDEAEELLFGCSALMVARIVATSLPTWIEVGRARQGLHRLGGGRNYTPSTSGCSPPEAGSSGWEHTACGPSRLLPQAGGGRGSEASQEGAETFFLIEWTNLGRRGCEYGAPCTSNYEFKSLRRSSTTKVM